MADDFEQKHEEPTPRRLEKAREEGQVARSREVSSLFFLVTAFIFFGLSGNHLILGLKEEMSGYFSQAAVLRIGPDSVNAFAARVLWDFLKTGFPLWGSFLGAAVLSFVVQGGWVWSPKALAMKWDRVSPAKGFSRLFSGRSLIELAKYTLKVILVLFILFVSLRKDWMALPQLEETGVHRFVGGLAHFLKDVLVRLVPLFLVIAVLDFLIQRVQLARSLRMSRAEIRDEFKETEGDPQVRSRIRTIQRAMARRRMMAKVKTATVVVTNPTHFAVALKYDMKTMTAPVVVAKGQDEIAANIRRVAREAGVPVVENPPLARTLYAACPIDREIPFAFYQAVAQVLSVLYDKKNWEEIRNGGTTSG